MLRNTSQMLYYSDTVDEGYICLWEGDWGNDTDWDNSTDWNETCYNMCDNNVCGNGTCLDLTDDGNFCNISDWEEALMNYTQYFDMLDLESLNVTESFICLNESDYDDDDTDGSPCDDNPCGNATCIDLTLNGTVWNESFWADTLWDEFGLEDNTTS